MKQTNTHNISNKDYKIEGRNQTEINYLQRIVGKKPKILPNS